MEFCDNKLSPLVWIYNLLYVVSPNYLLLQYVDKLSFMSIMIISKHELPPQLLGTVLKGENGIKAQLFYRLSNDTDNTVMQLKLSHYILMIK